MPSTKSIPLAFRVDRERHARLARLAAATDRPKTWILERALDAYLEDQLWQIERIKRGIADVEAGRVVSHEKAMAIFDRVVKNVGRKRHRKAASRR